MANFDGIKNEVNVITNWKRKNPLLYNRWSWHLLFWIGYCLFRLWPYYITVTYFNNVFLEYMLLSEIFFVANFYLTIYMYKRLFIPQKYIIFFIAGIAAWALYLYGRTVFQFYYLQDQPTFKGNTFSNIFINNIAFVMV